MLNKDTRAVLKQLSSINNSVVIANTMHGSDEFKGITYRVELNKIDKIPVEFGIYDTANFLGAMELLEDPTVTYNQDTNTITAGDGVTTLDFITSNVSSLEGVDVNPEIITSSLLAPSECEFTLSTDILTQIKKATAVFKSFDTLWILNDAKGTKIKLGTENSFSKSSNTYQVNITPDTKSDKEFNLAIPVENILKVPSVDYNVLIKYNTERDVYRLMLQNELFVFIMALKS